MPSRSSVLAALKGWLQAQIKGEATKLLMRQASAVYLTRMASFALQFGAGLLLGRQLGATDYGLYALAISAIVVARVAAALGLPMMLMKFTASYLASEDWPHLKGVLQFAGLAFLGGGLAAAGLMAGGVVVLSPRPLPLISQLILLSLPLLLILSTFEGAVNVIRGLHKVARGQLPDLCKTAIFLALLLSLIAFGQQLGPKNAMIMRVAADGCGAAIALIMALTLLPKSVFSARAAYATPAWRSGLMSFLAIDGIYLIYQQTDVLMLGLMRPSADVGVYRMATNIALVLLFVTNAGASTMAPHVASAWQTGNRRQLRQACVQMARFTTVISVTIYLALLIATPLFVYVLGPDFAALFMPLAIIGIGHLSRATTSPALNLTLMTGGERSVVAGIAGSAALNLVLNAALIPLFGMIGSAIATTLCQIWLAGYATIRGYQRTGVDASILGRHARHMMDEKPSGEMQR